MSVLAIMQPYLFPYIGYFQLISAVDKFVIYDDVNFINKGWINRNNILVNGKANLFSMPLIEASQNKLIREINIADDVKWNEKFLRTLEMCYKKAPHFSDTIPMISEIMLSKEYSLTKRIYQSLQIICNYLDIHTILEPTSVVYNNQYLKAQHRILDICKQEGVNQYINPIGGMEIYSKELFAENDIKLNFIKSNPILYKQFGNEFTPWLSIIDVLMFNTKADIKKMLLQYELV